MNLGRLWTALVLLSLGSVALAGRKNVLVLSSVTFHMEVSMFFTWLLHEMSHDITFVTRAAPLFSFSRASTVSNVVKTTKFITDLLPNPSLSNPDGWSLAVLITGNSDIPFLQKANKVAELKKSLGSRPLLIVNHHGNAAEVQPTIAFCRDNNFNCHIISLSRHTHSHMLQDLQEQHVKTEDLHFDYLYPVYDLRKLFGIDRNSFHSAAHSSLRLVLQGKVHSSRRDYGGLLSYMESRNESNSWHLDVLGQGAKSLKLASALKDRVERHDHVEYSKYYKVIKSADVLVCEFADAMGYDTTRASSSVPAAIMTGTPLLLPAKYLRLYDCLERGEAHKMWGGNATSNEQALDYLALHSSKSDLQAAHKETLQCFDEWHDRNVQVVKSILS